MCSAGVWDASADAYRPPHRSATGFIIDGHHKAAAYTSLGVPTRTILICDRMPRQQPGTDDPLAVFDELSAPGQEHEPSRVERW